MNHVFWWNSWCYATCWYNLHFDETAETVTYRIFYYINRSGNGRITFRELKRGNLIDAMLHADEEEDINKVLRYWQKYLRAIVVFIVLFLLI